MCLVIKHTALVYESITAGSVAVFKPTPQTDLLYWLSYSIHILCPEHRGVCQLVLQALKISWVLTSGGQNDVQQFASLPFFCHLPEAQSCSAAVEPSQLY